MTDQRDDITERLRRIGSPSTLAGAAEIASLRAVLRNIVDCYGVGSTPEKFCEHVSGFIEEARGLLMREGRHHD